ncbi:RSP_2648 family PIN domain-containing protein [Halovulum sp. GXIMD14793]
MRLCLDACVLYPTILREILTGCANAGLLAPVWSPRILEEWARAAARLGPEGEAVARGEIAMLRATYPAAEVTPTDIDTLWLPDENDRHVLAAAITGRAGGIVTLNIRDFPLRVLAEHNIDRWHPDELFLRLAGPELTDVVEAVRRRTEDISGRPQPLRPLLKRAKLPRLGKLLG